MNKISSVPKEYQLIILKIKKTENKIKSLIEQNKDPKKEISNLLELFYNLEFYLKEPVTYTNFQRKIIMEYCKT